MFNINLYFILKMYKQLIHERKHTAKPLYDGHSD